MVAAVNVCIAFTSKASFEEAIGGKYSESVGKNNKIKMLKHVPLFKTLTTEQYNGIIKAIVVEEFGDGCQIFQENDPGDSLFIIKSGKVDVIKKGVYLRSIGKHSFFGERSILFSSPRTATIVANGRLIV